MQTRHGLRLSLRDLRDLRCGLLVELASPRRLLHRHLLLRPPEGPSKHLLLLRTVSDRRTLLGNERLCPCWWSGRGRFRLGRRGCQGTVER